MMIHTLVRAIANMNIALDYSGETIDEDDVVDIMEQFSADLQKLDADSRKILSDAFRHIAREYEGELREYVKTFPYAIGIEDEEV